VGVDFPNIDLKELEELNELEEPNEPEGDEELGECTPIFFLVHM